MSLGIVHRVEDFRHQWAGDPRSARKRQPVDPLYDRLRRIERTFHSVDDVAYEFVIHVKLPVSEELHQHLRQQRLVRFTRFHHRHGLEARAQIWQRDRPGRRPLPAGHQKRRAILAYAVDDMEEFGIIKTTPIGVLEQHRPPFGRARGIRARLRMNLAGLADIFPDIGKVRFSGTGRPCQHDHRRGPVRPCVNEADGGLQRSRHEEILPAGGGRMRKCERQLLGLRPGVVGFDWVSHCQL